MSLFDDKYICRHVTTQVFAYFFYFLAGALGGKCQPEIAYASKIEDPYLSRIFIMLE